MRRHSPIATVLLLTLLASVSLGETVVSVDARNHLLNTDTGGALKAYRLGDPVEVRVNGVAGQIDQLRPGMQVTLGFLNPQTVNRIQATEPVKAALGNETGTRRVMINVRVDGLDQIKVRDGKLWIEHKTWGNPTEIRVNGHAWKPVWNGMTSDEFTSFIPGLAPFNGAVVEVKKLKGRGSAVVKQQPSTENDQTLIVEIDDTPPQSGMYEVEFGW